MKFRLHFNGDLKPRKSAGLRDIHAVRESFHPQLQNLWELDPYIQLSQNLINRTTYNVGGIDFRPAISKGLHLYAEIEVTFLRPKAAGDTLMHGADIDNRIKTLLDALRIPSKQQIEKENLKPPQKSEPFFVLLQDDALVSKISFEADRLLGRHSPNHSIAIIEVTTRRSTAMAFNDIFV